MLTAMKTAVLVESGSCQQRIPLVLEPASKARRTATRGVRAGANKQAPKPKQVVVPFYGSKPRLEAADGRIHVPKLVFWESLELGFVMVLLLSAFALISLSAAAAGNL
jgi:hypothetical protein